MIGASGNRLEAVTVGTAGAVAGLAVTVPIDLRWLGGGSALEMQILVTNFPLATAAGALAAVMSAVMCGVAPRFSTWLVAGIGTALLLLGRIVARGLTDGLTTSGYAEAITGGVVMGALASLVVGRSLETAGLLLGALSGIVIGSRTPPPGAGEQLQSMVRWALVSPPPLPLIAAAALLLGWCAWRNRTPVPGHEPREIPMRPVAAVLVLISASMLRSEWTVSHPHWAVQILLGGALTVLATLVAALLLPARDGTLVALTVAFAAAGSAVGAAPRPGWTIPVLVAAVAAGLWAGARWPRPTVAAAATVALAVFAAVTAGDGGSMLPVVGTVGIAAVGGYCFGTVVPGQFPGVALAIAMLFAPSILAAAVRRRFDTSGGPRLFESGTVAWPPGWAAVAVTAGCGAVAFLLHRMRPAVPVLAVASQ